MTKNQKYVAFGLEVLHEDVPNGDDVADGAGEDEEMEHGMHEPLAEAVEDGSGDVADALGDNPRDGSRADGEEQRLEGDEHGEAHEAEADGFEVAVVAQTDEGGDGAGYGCRPYEDEHRPAPRPLLAHGNEGDGRVASGYVPVDGGVVPLAEPLFPRVTCREGVVDGGGDVAHEHAEEIEDDACCGPSVFGTGTPHQEDDADDDT